MMVPCWKQQNFFFSSRRRHTRCGRDWSSDVCSSDLGSVGHPKSHYGGDQRGAGRRTILVVAPASCRLSRGHLALTCGGRDAPPQPPGTAMLLLPPVFSPLGAHFYSLSLSGRKSAGEGEPSQGG